MTSLWKKLQLKRRRQSPWTNKTKKNWSVVEKTTTTTTTTCGNHGPAKKGQVPPMETVNLVGVGKEVVSPLKSPPAHHLHRMSSSAFTDTTQSCHSWSEDHDLSYVTNTTKVVSSPTNTNSTTTTLTTATTVPATDKLIPPRPTRSHWKEEDFLRVVHVWDLSQEEIYMMRELEAKLYDVTHWKNNPFEVVRFMKGPQGYKPAERLFRKMIQVREILRGGALCVCLSVCVMLQRVGRLWWCFLQKSPSLSLSLVLSHPKPQQQLMLTPPVAHRQPGGYHFR